MELDVNGAIVKNPSAADIVRALDAASFPHDWYISLDNESGGSLDAQAQADGKFYLSFGDNKRRPPQQADAATVKALYLAFLAGDAGPHAAASAPGAPADAASSATPHPKFVPDTRPLVGRAGDQPPLPAIVVMVAVIGLVGLTFGIERGFPGTIRHHVPFGNSDFFWIGLIFLPMLALILVAIATKLIEMQRAKSWVETTGHIVRSQTAVRRHQFDGEAETIKTVPDVEYEFKVGARTVHGMRIGIGDEALADPEATLKRYPVGAHVSVYYDPRDPKNCVLERGGPDIGKREAASGCVEGLALLAVLAGALWWLVNFGPDFVRAHFPHTHAEPPFVLAVTGFALLLLLFFIGARRRSKQAANWPSVRGKIVSSNVEEYQERDSDGRLRTNYRPAVEFAFSVRGQEYHGNQIKLDLSVSAGRGYAEKVVAKYPAGSAVAVHYDPAHPATAALENPTGATWIIAAAGLGFLAFAVWLLGVFG